jgi:hypothetical protein
LSEVASINKVARKSGSTSGTGVRTVFSFSKVEILNMVRIHPNLTEGSRGSDLNIKVIGATFSFIFVEFIGGRNEASGIRVSGQIIRVVENTILESVNWRCVEVTSKVKSFTSSIGTIFSEKRGDCSVRDIISTINDCALTQRSSNSASTST